MEKPQLKLVKTASNWKFPLQAWKILGGFTIGAHIFLHTHILHLFSCRKKKKSHRILLLISHSAKNIPGGTKIHGIWWEALLRITSTKIKLKHIQWRL